MLSLDFVCVGFSTPGSRDGCGEVRDESRRPEHGGVQPGVGGVLRPGKQWLQMEHFYPCLRLVSEVTDTRFMSRLCDIFNILQ